MDMVIEMTGMEGVQRVIDKITRSKTRSLSWPELEYYKQRWLKYDADDESNDEDVPNYINVDIDNYSVASSIPTDEEEEALDDLNNVLEALDDVNAQSTLKDPLDI